MTYGINSFSRYEDDGVIKYSINGLEVSKDEYIHQMRLAIEARKKRAELNGSQSSIDAVNKTVERDLDYVNRLEKNDDEAQMKKLNSQTQEEDKKKEHNVRSN
jgi:hypothetical protein|tara:strand:- start:941 stop:1249 length:309 start_codon:yes stop_codon:yes gene_type:complete